jgi:flagellar basal-body rod modification protein FlgD
MVNAVTDPIVDATAAAAAAAAARSQAPSSVVGKDQFLQLLIAQLTNQDPLKPADDKEFVAQMATFSSLEQLMDVNQNLQGLAFGQANLVNAQALDLIGKDALVEGGETIRVRRGEADRVVYALPKPAGEATLTIYGPDGTPVRTIALDTDASGRVNLEWDGLDADGKALADGDYRYEVHATDLEGAPMIVAVFRALPIDGVNFGEAGLSLVSGDREIPFETILEIRAGRP